MPMCHSAFFSPSNLGMESRLHACWGKCFTSEFHAPVLSWIILYHERKMIFPAGESWKEA